MSRKAILMVCLVLFISLVGVQVVGAGAARPVEQGRQLALPILVVNTGALNVRSGPGPQYTVVTVVRGGTELPVLGMNPDGSWFYVASPGGAGWVDVDFTIPRGNFSFVPTIRPAIGQPPAVNTPGTLQLPGYSDQPTAPRLAPAQIIVNTGALNVRSGPGGFYSVVAVVPGGTVLDGIGVTTDGVWYLVEGSFGRGWVNAPFTIFRGTYSNLAVISY